MLANETETKSDLICHMFEMARFEYTDKVFSFISALAHHGVMTAYIDYALGHATSEVSALLAGYISNVTPAMMQAFNEKIFIVPPIM